MPSSRYLLRVEAINIYANIFDTDQLSVVRGSGLLLREAIVSLRRAIVGTGAPKDGSDGSPWDTISIGASVGVFAVTGIDPAQLKTQICDFLANHQHYRLFTFAVACTPWPDEENFREAQERVLAELRWQQQQQPSVALERVSKRSQGACDWDHVRPGVAANRIRRDPKDAIVSESVFRRFLYGRDAKLDATPDYTDSDHESGLARFYARETDSNDDPGDSVADILRDAYFANDFDQIANNRDAGNLDGKLAVFYADGNRFSSVVRSMDNAKDLLAFDTAMRSRRRKILRGLLRWAWQTPGMRFKAKKWREKSGLRMEVLLWGGDEVLIVVPAWCGFALMSEFFALTRDWAPAIPRGVADSLKPSPDKRDKPALTTGGFLTHGAGLVFCHHKTPIARMHALARDLGDLAKKKLGLGIADVYEVLALESIDYPSGSLSRFNTRRVGALLASGLHPRLPLRDIGAVRELLGWLPRSQVYALVQALTQSSHATCPSIAALRDVLTHAGMGADQLPDASLDDKKIWSIVGSLPWKWQRIVLKTLLAEHRKADEQDKGGEPADGTSGRQAKPKGPSAMEKAFARLAQMLRHKAADAPRRDDAERLDARAVVAHALRVLSENLATYDEHGDGAAPPDTLADADPWTWVHLRELWDYLIADPAKETSDDVRNQAEVSV